MRMSLRTHVQTNTWQDGLKHSDCNTTEGMTRGLAGSIVETLAYCLAACVHEMWQAHVPMCRGSMAVGAGPGTGGAAAEGLAHGVQKVCFSFTCVCVCVLASTSSALEDPQVSKTRVVRLI